jgi:hypothetical protein
MMPLFISQSQSKGGHQSDRLAKRSGVEGGAAGEADEASKRMHDFGLRRVQIRDLRHQQSPTHDWDGKESTSRREYM